MNPFFFLGGPQVLFNASPKESDLIHELHKEKKEDD